MLCFGARTVHAYIMREMATLLEYGFAHLPAFTMIALLTTTIIVILIISKTITLTLLQRSSRTRKGTLPPGPWKLPIIGNLHQLMSCPLPHRRLRDLAQKYGPVMRLQLGEILVIVISTPEAAKQALRTRDVHMASRPNMLAPTIVFNGCKDIAFAPNGKHWREMRKICTVELLSPKRTLSFRSVREEEVSSLVACLSRSAVQGRPVNLTELLISVANKITCRSAFGKAEQLSEAFMIVIEQITDALGGFRLSDLFPSLKFLPLITGFRAKLTALHRAADSVLEKLISEHKARRLASPPRSSGEQVDLLDILLDLQENGNLAFPLTLDALKAVTLDMFLGGTETPATTMEWTMSEMIKNPKVLQKAQKEVRQVFADRGNVSEDGLPKLNYLNATIKESLRLHPPGPLLLPRESTKKVEIDGLRLPKNSRIFINVWAIGRDPRYWIEAEKFYPERFIDSSIDYKGTNFEFLPFGAGKRMCPGRVFGLVYVHLTLANLLFHFNWKLPTEAVKPQNMDMTERFGAAVARKNKLILIPLPR